MVIINPGNPTGQLFSENTLQEIIKFCYRHNLAIITDEVYQQNLFREGTEFHSVRKILSHMPEPYN